MTDPDDTQPMRPRDDGEAEDRRDARRREVIVVGDVLEVLRGMPANSFDAVLSDPPYGIGFMGKSWDKFAPREFQEWCTAWGREMLRVLKPGAPVLMFGGTRTYHRMTCAIEDAGFEVRDCLVWMYGSGFPKSLDVSKAIDAHNGDARPVVGRWSMPGRGKRSPEQKYGLSADSVDITSAASAASAAWSGYGTALKPAHEPCVLARKPLEGTVAANVERWGVGGLAIDASRIEASGRPHIQKTGEKWASTSMDAAGSRHVGSTDLGRWPANVILDEEAGAMVDEQSGELHGAWSAQPAQTKWLMENQTQGYGGRWSGPSGARFGDSGGASRFFYCAKVSKKERGEGNDHPTLKPIALTTYLARLIMPPSPGRILVPFAGTGSEVIGCLRAGWPEVVGIEKEPRYAEIANRRIADAA